MYGIESDYAGAKMAWKHQQAKLDGQAKELDALKAIKYDNIIRDLVISLESGEMLKEDIPNSVSEQLNKLL
jgi:hypothetical protein